MSADAHIDIDRRFTVAVSWIQNKNVQFPFKPTPKQSLFFYGRYKQATAGDNIASKPSMFTPIRRYMWSAHEKNKGKSSTQAKSEYVAEIDKLIAEFDLTTLPATLENDAHAFFSQFYGTPQHPHVQHLPSKRHLLSEEKKQQDTIEEGDEDAARSLPNSPEQQQPASPVAASAGNHKVRSPPELGNSDALFTSIPSSSASSSSSSAISSPQKGTTSASSSSSPVTSSSSSSSMTSPPRPSAQLLSEVSDKEQLAQRLIELQIANQQKMAQLERQMALMAARQGTPAKSDYTTPAKVGGIRSALHQSPATGLVGAAGAPLHSVVEPSSPFASNWTPSGLLAARPPLSASQPSARQQLFSPSTPFQTYHTPYTHHATSHLNGSSAPVRNLQAEIASIAEPSAPAASSSSITLSASSSSSQRPSRASSPSRDAAAPEHSALQTAALAYQAPFIASRAPASDALSSQDLDSLLGALDAKHRAQVAEFQAAEREWVERLAAAEARADQLQARVVAAEHGQVDSALSVSVNIEKKSFLHNLVASTATTVKIAVPVGVAAWTTFKLWREYERRVLKR